MYRYINTDAAPEISAKLSEIGDFACGFPRWRRKLDPRLILLKRTLLNELEYLCRDALNPKELPKLMVMGTDLVEIEPDVIREITRKMFDELYRNEDLLACMAAGIPLATTVTHMGDGSVQVKIATKERVYVERNRENGQVLKVHKLGEARFDDLEEK